MTQNVIATKTGFRFGCLFVPLFFGGFGLAGGLALVNQAVDAKLAGILSGTLVVGYIVMVFAVLAITMGKTAAITKRLRQNGLRGHGQVMLLQSTGVRVNRQPQLELTLQVSVPGREPFIVRHREVVSAVRIPQVQPGNNLPILVDPNDPAMLVIDWQ